MLVQNKNVIFFGGFGGIGITCIEEFLKKGIHNLMIIDLKENSQQLAAWQQEFAQQTTIYFQAVDVTELLSIQAAYQLAYERMGHFDLILNGCGFLNDQRIEQTVQVNLLGTIYSTMTALEYMDKSKTGHGGLIVNISSVVGLSPSLMFAIYSATKTAVTTFTCSLAHPLVYNKTGVGFITICPAFTKTPLFDEIHKKLTFIDGSLQTLCDKFQLVDMQTPAEVARNLLSAVEIGRNGSVWVIESGEMKDIELPTLWKPKIKESK